MASRCSQSHFGPQPSLTIRKRLVEDEVPLGCNSLQGCLSAGRELQVTATARGIWSWCWEAEQAYLLQAFHSSSSLNSGANFSSLITECLTQREKINNYTQRGKANFTTNNYYQPLKVILRNDSIPFKYAFPKYLNIHVQSIMIFFKLLLCCIYFCLWLHILNN